MKVLLRTWNHTGDRIIATAVIRDLKQQYPEYQIGIDTPWQSVFENNPYIDWGINADNADKIVKLKYAGSERTADVGHCIDGVIKCINRELGINIKLSILAPDLHIPAVPTEYNGCWIINAGYQTTSSVKNIGISRYQEIVDALPEIKFIQIGGAGERDVCKPLQRVENLIGKTSIKEVYSLLRGSNGVISPPSFIIHMNHFDIPSIVLNGGREPDALTDYRNTFHFSSVGKYKCCENHACMKRIVTNRAHRTNCVDIIKIKGERVPRCMAELSIKDIVAKTRALNDARS